MRSLLRRWDSGLLSGGLSLALLRRDVRASCVSAFLGESRNLSSRPRLPTCSLPDGFHALVNKSMELLFQVWRKVREEFIWWSPCSDSVKKYLDRVEATVASAMPFHYFPVAGNSREGEIPGSRIPCGTRVQVSLGWFWAALITRATDLRIIPPELSKGGVSFCGMRPFRKCPSDERNWRSVSVHPD